MTATHPVIERRLKRLSAIAYVTELNVGSERGLADGQGAIQCVRRTCIAGRNPLRIGAQAQAANNSKKRTMPTVQHVCIPQCLVGCPRLNREGAITGLPKQPPRSLWRAKPRLETSASSFDSQCLLLKPVLDNHFRGRDRDRTIQGSPAFEAIQQLLRLLVIDSAHFKVKANGIEE